MLNKQGFRKYFEIQEVKLFVIVFFTLCLFWNNHIILNDEHLIIAQLESLKDGKLDINLSTKIKYTGFPFFKYNGKEYSSFAHALPLMALPFYYMFVELEKFFYVEFFLFLIPWLMVLFLFFVTNSSKYRVYIVTGLIVVNIFLFKPIYLFEDWASLYSIQFTNILLGSLAALIFYRFLSPEVGVERAFLFSVILIFGTPIGYWTLTAKHHALSILFTVFEVYLLDRYFKSKKFWYLASFSIISGLLIWIRPAEGISMFLALSIILLYSSISERRIHNIKFLVGGVILMLVGYAPCAVLGYYMYNLPVPPTLMGNFLAAEYLKRSLGLVNIIKILPTTIFGVNGETFGLFTYSPFYVVILFFAVRGMIDFVNSKSKKFGLRNIEKYMILSSLLVYALQLPFLKAGIIDTGVRDYRFYLPLYVFLTYFIAKEVNFQGVDDFLRLFFYFIVTVIFTLSFAVAITRGEVFQYIKYFYFIASTVIGVLFIYITLKPSNLKQIKSELLVFGTLPTILLFSDRLVGYYTPYDIHFVFPIIDRFIELMIKILCY